MSERRRTLVQALAVWVALSTAVGLLAFAGVALFVTIALEQAEPDHDAPEVILDEARSEVGTAVLVGAPIGLALAVLGALAAVRRTLRPLHGVIETASRITARELSLRLPPPAANDEVRDLVLALNGLLGRLESGFDALERFSAEASHELRTPLAVMAAELETMLKRPRSPSEWERTGLLCLDEVTHLARLVTALLQMARAERTPRCDAQGIAFGELMANVRAAAFTRARARDVQLQIALGAANDCWIAGDGDALQSAIANVVDNSLQYAAPRGAVRLSAECQGDSLVLHVDDDGPGIDSLERKRIFEPFVRGEVGRATTGGFGLGLTIARRICEHNHATLSAASSPGGGARFSFTFRVAPARPELPESSR